MSISNLSLIVISFCSLLLTYFETTSLYSVIQKNNLESYISATLPELKFTSQEEKQTKINSMVERTKATISPPFDNEVNYSLGRLLLVSGLESTNPEDRLNRICNARESIIKASKSAPRNIEYQLAIADIESISNSLISTCDSINQVKNSSISLNERLQWIAHLAPNDPPILYKKGIIERSIGSRLEAMKSFRKFEENSLASSQEYRLFFISQAQSEGELNQLLPRKYPNLLTWTIEYFRNPNPNINYKASFEYAFLEMIESISNDDTLTSKQLLEKLYKIYWFRGIQYSEPVKNTLAKLIFKTQSLHANESFPKHFFGSLVNQKKIPILISKYSSGLSKKSSQIYNWTSSNDPNAISIDIRSEGLGIFLPANSKTETMIIQGDAGEKNISNLKADIWASDDNISYTHIKSVQSSQSGIIDNRPIATFDVPDINSKYLKVFLSLNSDKTQKLTAPANLILQFFTKR